MIQQINNINLDMIFGGSCCGRYSGDDKKYCYDLVRDSFCKEYFCSSNHAELRAKAELNLRSYYSDNILLAEPAPFDSPAEANDIIKGKKLFMQLISDTHDCAAESYSFDPNNEKWYGCN